MRTLTSLMSNRQRLDGGAMFGNVPRALWSRWAPPDEHHRIELACRCLLIEQPNHRILCETGIGAFLEPRLRERFGVVESDHMLLASLAERGLTDADIDVVVLSHLHFDHAGGLLSAWKEGEEPHLLFPNARFVVGHKAFARAEHPHARDRASFIATLQPLLRESGRLDLVRGPSSELLGADFRLHYADGHTPGLMMLEVSMPEGPVVFVSDLIPGRPWVHLPVTMGYDRAPEMLIDEKRVLLTQLCGRNARLFFTHDPEVALARVSVDERGRFSAGATLPMLDQLVA